MRPVELAKQLGKALAESTEYQNYKKFKGILDQHESAKAMMEDFRKKQWELERRKLSGDKQTQTSEDELRKLSEIIGLNPYIRDYLMAEYQFSQLMMEVQKIIGEAVGLEIPKELLANGNK
ncbi:MAG: YlbF family regulator [Firmicutes bacterium]|nr:YlbF family regulator [Bacillota bacterium]